MGPMILKRTNAVVRVRALRGRFQEHERDGSRETLALCGGQN